MRIRKWVARLFDPRRDVQERMFFLILGLGIIALFIIILVGLIVGESKEDMLTLFGCLIIFSVVFLVAVRTGRTQLFATISALILLLFLLPVSFFTGGGIYGGSAFWFVFSTMFICITVAGRKKWILLAVDAAVAVACYYISYMHPELVYEHTRDMAFLDSFASVVIVCILVVTMVEFEIRILQRALQQSREQIRKNDELNKAQSRFFSSISHEIRTPLNTIIGLDEMILREDISDEVAEDAMSIRDSSKILMHLINDILDMAKIEAGKMEVTPVNYSANELLSDISNMFWTAAGEKGLEFKVEIDPDIPEKLFGDDVRIKQILINLLSNAFKYTNEGSVTFSAEHREAEDGVVLIFTVSDTGVGIRKENLPHLFDAFERLNEEENRYVEGTGLGLAIVKQFTELMGGSVTVNSVYTQGSTFVVELPQGVSGEGRVGRLDMQKRSVAPREDYNQRFEAPEAKALVVDDNLTNLMVTTKLLRDTKIAVDTADSGKAALELTLKTAYNIIFMDHLMPEMDGIECLHKLRRQAGGLCKEAKVVALTANAGNENQMLYAREGFDGYLVKPTTGEALERECQRLLPDDLIHIVHTDDQIVEGSVSWLTEKRRKMQTAITTDSIADLPKNMLQKNRIAVIPHVIITEEGKFMDGIEIESDGLLSYLTENDKFTETHAPEVEEYETFFAEQLQNANNIIHISLSAQTRDSGLYRAVEAAKSFDNVTVIDSEHLSSGEGLMVLEASQMARAEMPTNQIVAKLEAMKPLIHTSFIVDDLDYLVRARQVNARVLRPSRVFMLHPVLRMKKGVLHVSSVHFGSRQNAWKKYIHSEFRFAKAVDRSRLFITYVGLTQAEVEFIKEEVNKCIQFDEVIVNKASPAITVNCGPGTFGLLYKSLDTSNPSIG